MIEKECWSLDKTFATFILPRLLYFKNWVTRMGVPMDFENDEGGWEEVLDELTWTFTYIHNDYPSVAELFIEDVIFEENTIEVVYTDPNLYEKGREQDKINMARCQRGLNLFAKYYRDLWD